MSNRVIYSLLWIFGSIWTGQSAMGQTSSYPELQAAYIFNFAKYVKWPSEGETFVIAVYGEVDSIDLLQRTLRDKTVRGRRIEFKILSAFEELTNVNIVYVPESGSDNIRKLLTAIQNRSILVVTEEDLIKKGATISFIVEEDRLKFKVSEAVLKQAGLSAAEGLLRLAILQ